jgi:cytoskeletal protein CcmA (bactofilin family)
VIGDIKAVSLVMEAGAIFVGASTIGTPQTRPGSAKPAGSPLSPGSGPKDDSKNPVAKAS